LPEIFQTTAENPDLGIGVRDYALFMQMTNLIDFMALPVFPLTLLPVNKYYKKSYTSNYYQGTVYEYTIF
jgi:hypothetical protein